MTLRTFLGSFTACALTLWCFDTHADEEKYFSSLGDGDVKRCFENGELWLLGPFTDLKLNALFVQHSTQR